MNACAPSSSCSTEGGYEVKSSRRTTLIFGFEAAWVLGRGRRERMTMEVMRGEERHWERTSEPMKPVAPVRMSFIFLGGWVLEQRRRNYIDQYYKTVLMYKIVR